eukprot:3748811-Rhodomonas_salina.3
MVRPMLAENRLDRVQESRLQVEQPVLVHHPRRQPDHVTQDKEATSQRTVTCHNHLADPGRAMSTRAARGYVFSGSEQFVGSSRHGHPVCHVIVIRIVSSTLARHVAWSQLPCFAPCT